MTIIPNDALFRKLTQGAGSCLVSVSFAQGLLVLTEPMRWIEHGCDLDLDILPTRGGGEPVLIVGKA